MVKQIGRSRFIRSRNNRVRFAVDAFLLEATGQRLYMHCSMSTADSTATPRAKACNYDSASTRCHSREQQILDFGAQRQAFYPSQDKDRHDHSNHHEDTDNSWDDDQIEDFTTRNHCSQSRGVRRPRVGVAS
ncbi:unnamed protein product [Merluccius merluccius]